MATLVIKTHVYKGEGHETDLSIPDVPSFSSIEEAYAWSYTIEGHAILKALLDAAGEKVYSLEFSK